MSYLNLSLVKNRSSDIASISSYTKKKISHFCLLLISTSILIISPENLLAQQKETAALYKYTQNQGLSSYNTRKIIQDKYGFMWIATQDGLNRFDGRNFNIYTKNSPAGKRLTGTDIRDLIEDKSKDHLWILSNDGLDCLDTKTGNIIPSASIKNTVNDEWNLTMILMEDEIWIGTFKGIRIFNTKNRKYTIIKSPASNTGKLEEVRSLFIDDRKNVWAGLTGVGIQIFNGRNKRLIRTIPNSLVAGPVNKEIRFLSAIQDNKDILFATSSGLRKISYDQKYTISVEARPCKLRPLLNGENIYHISRSNTGHWFISSQSGLYNFSTLSGSFTVITEKQDAADSEWLKTVFYSYFDDRNNLWLGCQEGLALMKLESPFQPFYSDIKTGLKLNHVLSLNPAADRNRIYAGLRNGMIEINRKSHKFRRMRANDSYQHIYYDPFGKLQVSNPRGCLVLDKGSWRPNSSVYKEFRDYDDRSINSHVSSGDSLLVMGTENDKGILIWNYKKHRLREITTQSQPALAADIVNTVYKDKKERFWVLSDKVLTVLNPSLSTSRTLKFYDKERMLRNYYFDICEAQGFYWIATYGTGIIKLDQNYRISKILTTIDGLSNGGAYKIFPVGDTSLVITTNNGLAVYNINNGTFKNYYQEDGLHSSGFEEACGVLKDGKIYAGGIKGFTIVDPALFKVNRKAPRVYVNRINIETLERKKDTGNLVLKQLKIPADVLQATLFFSGINYANPLRTTFAYRFLERDKDWTDIGSQNFINIIGLPPGEYTLQVKAANEDGLWSVPAQLVLIYMPKWYQTSWFKILLLCAGSGIAYLIYSIHILQARKENNIRSSIANDLHDDIGSTLNSIKIFTHLAIAQPLKTEYLENIKANLTHASTGLRDMIWILDDQRDTVADLMNRLRQQMLPIADAIQIELIFITEDAVEAKTLLKTEKRNLYFIAKEAINNSIKYAECSAITVELALDKKKNEMTIRDNGKGFDVSSAIAGYGLKNMRSRAEQIGYSIKIYSTENEGTSINVTKK